MNIKKDIYIFFAATPLHLICINEFRKSKNISKYKLILILHKGNKLALKQIYITLKLLDFKEFSIFWVPKIKIFRFIGELRLIIDFKIISIRRNISFLLIDFRNIFMQSLRRYFKESDFTLIDDGFYTFVAQEKFMSKNIFLPIYKKNSVYSWISKLIYYGNSYSRIKKTPLKLYTIYADEIDNNNATMNELAFIKSKFESQNINISYELVFFIGTQMAERGALTLKQELNLVKTTNKYWLNKKKKMFYIGKRSTSKEKLNLFNKNGIKTKQFDLPLELAFFNEQTIPGNICSLGSTLQKSLDIIFDNKINFYFINIKDFFKVKIDDTHIIKMDEVDHIAATYSETSSRIKTISLT